MKILLVSTSYPLTADSSSGIFVKRLRDALVSYARVDVLSPDDTLSSDNTKAIIRARYAPKNWQRLAHQPGGIPAALRRNPWYFLLVPILIISMQISIIKRVREYDAVFANWAVSGLIASLPAYLFGKPLFTTFRGEDVRNLHKKVQRWIVKSAIKMSKKVVLVSADMKQDLVSVFPEYESKLVVIPNGVDDGFLGSELAAAGKYNEQEMILTVSSLIPRKNTETIIKALSLLEAEQRLPQKLILSIAGEGELRRQLEQLSDDLGIRDAVKFLGEIPPDDLLDHYRKARIFVLASLFEGRPNVVVEAMAAGCCIVVSEISGTKELIQDEHNGLMFDPENPIQLKECLQKVLEDRDSAIRMGECARQTIIDLGLSWQGTAEQYFALFGRYCSPIASGHV